MTCTNTSYINGEVLFKKILRRPLSELKDNIKVDVRERVCDCVERIAPAHTVCIARHFVSGNELRRFHKSASFLDQMRNYEHFKKYRAP